VEISPANPFFLSVESKIIVLSVVGQGRVGVKIKSNRCWAAYLITNNLICHVEGFAGAPAEAKNFGEKSETPKKFKKL
jgi:hypothetical protein